MSDATCSAEGCDKPQRAKAKCVTHYMRDWARSEGPRNQYVKGSAIERLTAHLSHVAGPLRTACWISNYAKDAHGYASFGIDGRRVKTHRFMYEYHVGLIPEGFHLDHLCRMTGCCNPAHLEPVTPGENFRRGVSPNNIARLTNTCKRGHPLIDAWVGPDGRQCRKCHSDRERQRRKAA